MRGDALPREPESDCHERERDSDAQLDQMSGVPARVREQAEDCLSGAEREHNAAYEVDSEHSHREREDSADGSSPGGQVERGSDG